MIDTDDINRNLEINDARVVLAHEIGHFFADGREEDDAIANYENPFRDALGFPARGRYGPGLAGYPRLPGAGGMHFP